MVPSREQYAPSLWRDPPPAAGTVAKKIFRRRYIMKILVTDGMDKTALEQLKNNGHEVTEQFYAPEELGAALKE